MNLAEALNIPKGMTFEEYESLLKQKHRLEKSISKLSEDIDFENDSLEVLAAEKGSELYKKHLLKKQKAENNRERKQTHLKAIISILG